MSAGHAPLEALGQIPFFAASQPGAGGGGVPGIPWCSLVYSCIALPSSSRGFLFSVSSLLVLIRMLVIGFGTHLGKSRVVSSQDP